MTQDAAAYSYVSADEAVARQLRAAAEAVRQAEENYRDLFDNAIEGLFQSTADGRLVHVNPAFVRIFGYDSPQEVIQSINDIAHQIYVDPQRRAELRCRLEQDGVVTRFESQVYQRDGGVIWVSENVRAVRDAAGRLRHYEGTVEDITDRKRAEQALADSEKRFRALIENSSDNIFITNREGCIEYVNAAFVQLTGYSRAEAIGRTPRLLKSGQHDEAFYHTLWQTILAGEVFRAVLTNRKKNGELYDEEKTITPLRDEQGMITHFVSAGKDITDHRRVEAALRKSEKHLQMVLSVTTDAVYDWDVRVDMTRWNHGLQSLFGHTGDEVRAHAWWRRHIHPDDLPRVAASLEATFQQRAPVWSCEYRYRRADDSYAHVIDRGYLMYDDDGPPTRMVGVMVDITDRVQLAEARVRATLEERRRLARDLHDSVTQSLYSLTLLAEAARRLAKAGDLERVENQVMRLGETAQQALKEMRLLVYELRPQPLEQEGLIGALQQRLDAVEKRSGVNVRLLIENVDRLPDPIEAALYFIAQEALNNALKHSGATSITVKLSGEPRRIRLNLIDNGRGFDQAAITDRGGLGLTSMRERAERFGGSLTIESMPDQGTQLSVDISWPEEAQ